MKHLVIGCILFTMISAVGCSAYKLSGGDTTVGTGDISLHDQAAQVIRRFKQRDPNIKHFVDTAYGYAVFPTVGKGAIGIGAAYGDGEVYEQGRLIGYTSMTQGTIGLQLGGQAFSEIIFFKDKGTLEDFKRGNLEFSAAASAVVVTAGASADADFEDGVAVFTATKGGLMYEASIGGQKFSYVSK